MNGVLDELYEIYNNLHNVISEEKIGEIFNQKLHNSIQDEIDSLPDNINIALRPCNMTTINFINDFNFGNKNIVGIFDDNRSFNFSVDNINLYNKSDIDKYEVDCVFITSFNFREEIKLEFKNSKYNIVDIYEVIEKRFDKLYAPIDKYKLDNHEILHFYISRFKNSNSDNFEDRLRDLMLITIGAKDFVLLKELCNKYRNKYDFVKEVEYKYNELMNFIKNKISERNNKDIIMHWVDSVPYRWFPDLSKIYELSKQNLCFENSYTTTSFTNQTMYSMFDKVLPLDNIDLYNININKQAKLIKLLDYHGYDFKYMSFATMEIYDEDCLCDAVYFDIPRNTINNLQWEVLKTILGSERPVFIFYQIMETHMPMISPMIDAVYYNNINIVKNNKDAAFKYVDDRLYAFYNLFKDNIQIFLSDHGDHNFIENEDVQWGQFWKENNIHAFCFVTGLNITKKVDEIFSYYNFIELIKWILGNREEEMNFLSDYFIFQDTDIYSKYVMNFYFKRNLVKNALAYRGASNKKYKYATNAIGEEFFYKIENDIDIEIDKSENIKDFKTLKNLAGNYFPDVSKINRFKNVHLLYDAFENR